MPLLPNNLHSLFGVLGQQRPHDLAARAILSQAALASNRPRMRQEMHEDAHSRLVAAVRAARAFAHTPDPDPAQNNPWWGLERHRLLQELLSAEMNARILELRHRVRLPHGRLLLPPPVMAAPGGGGAFALRGAELGHIRTCVANLDSYDFTWYEDWRLRKPQYFVVELDAQDPLPCLLLVYTMHEF